MNDDYSERMWAEDVLKAVNEGKPMDARLVAEAWRIVGVNDDNTATYIRQAFVALGVEASNIRGVYHSPGGFAPRPNRWCVIFHRVPGLSANAVNAVEGVSGAVWNGSVCHLLVGKGE